MKTNIVIKRERHYLPHQDLQAAAKYHHEEARKQTKPNKHSIVACLVLNAFAFEAYMNFIGPRVEPGWSDLDWASPLGKLRHIACVLALPLDFGRRPLQTIKALVDFRNRMAHPREARLKHEEFVESGYDEGSGQELLPDWMQLATLESAKRSCDDLNDVMWMISKKAEKKGIRFFDTGWETGCMQIVKDEPPKAD